VAEVFRLQVVGAKDVRSPIKTIVHTHIIHIKVHLPSLSPRRCTNALEVENVYVMTATKANVNISTVFEVYRSAMSALVGGAHFFFFARCCTRSLASFALPLAAPLTRKASATTTFSFTSSWTVRVHAENHC
jgi:hypothetical protein